MIPKLSASIEMPEPLSSDRSVRRMHNKAAKEAMRIELVNHHKTRIPGHFVTAARSKYGHMERQPGWKKIKLRRYKSRTDLVATGKTREAMKTSYKIRIGGKASDDAGNAGQLKGQIIMKFPFPVSRKGSKVRVTTKQMAKEISAVVTDEKRAVAQGFKKTYVTQINEQLKRSPRIRKRLGL